MAFLYRIVFKKMLNYILLYWAPTLMCICGVFHLSDHSLNYQNMCVCVYINMCMINAPITKRQKKINILFVLVIGLF